MALAVTFIVVGFLLCIAAILAVFGIIHAYMAGSDAIERDGMLPGTVAPSWVITGSTGLAHRSPPAGGLQVIVFGNHGLKSFPSALEGLRELSELDPAPQIVVLTDGHSSLTEPFFQLLGLPFTVVDGSRSLYARYNVRVTPFIIIVDAVGRVRASSLVNHDWQVLTLYKIACLPPEPVRPMGSHAPAVPSQAGRS